MGGMFGGSKQKTSERGSSTQTVNPWAPTIPHLENLVGDASSMYSSGGFNVEPYTGQRVADLSAPTRSAIDMLQRPSPVTPVAFGRWQEMLDPSRFESEIAGIREGVTDRTKAALAGMFSGSGMGSSLAGPEATRTLATALAPIEYNALQNAEQRRLQALGMAPTMQGLYQTDIGNMQAAGGMLDRHQQAVLDAQMQQYREGQQEPIDAIARYSSLLGALAGLGGTQEGDYNKRGKSSGSSWGFNFNLI